MSSSFPREGLPFAGDGDGDARYTLITFLEFGCTTRQRTARYRRSRDFSKHLARRDFQGSLNPPQIKRNSTVGGGEKRASIATVQKEGQRYEREGSREQADGTFREREPEGDKRRRERVEEGWNGGATGTDGGRDREPERNRRNEFISTNATS